MRRTKLNSREHFRKATKDGIIQILLETHKLVQYVVQPHVSYKVTINALRYLGCVKEAVLQNVEELIARGKITPNTKYTEREIRSIILEEIDPEGFDKAVKEQMEKKL